MYEVNNNLIAEQLNAFRGALKGGKSKELTYSSGRFDPKAFARRETDGFFKRPANTVDGKPVITMIVDCSGSMSGQPMEGAIQMCCILSRLHEANVIHANILCTGYSRTTATKNGYKVPMPQPDWVWAHLSAVHGREGISQTFTMFKDIIASSDLVTCYTDADISDSELKPQLWKRHGVNCIGMYCGPIGQVGVMLRYFDHAIARTNVRDLFTSYLTVVKQLLRARRG